MPRGQSEVIAEFKGIGQRGRAAVRSSYQTLEEEKTIMKLAETAEQIAYVG